MRDSSKSPAPASGPEVKTAGVDPYGPQPASNPYEQGRHDLQRGQDGAAEFGQQFAGQDEQTAATPAALAHGAELQGLGSAHMLSDIGERLAASGLRVDAVSYAVVDGVVALSGFVPDRGTKHAIQDLVFGCSGVAGVDNQLKVRRPARGFEDDEGLARAVDEYTVLNGRQA